MPKMSRRITRSDVLHVERYLVERPEHRARIRPLQQTRRLEVGPCASLAFESWDTIWFQIQEMLVAGGGGSADIDDELAAFNPLVPNGRSLVATLMLEIDSARQRRSLLPRLEGIERSVSLVFGSTQIRGRPQDDLGAPNGGAQALRFLHFDFAPLQAARFKLGGVLARVLIDHPQYTHAADMPEKLRVTLARDLARIEAEAF